MKVGVDPGRCVGAGQCVWVAPKVFDQRAADGIVVLLQSEPGPEDAPFVREAAERCPARAIHIDHTPEETT
jgi:ferredoxin